MVSGPPEVPSYSSTKFSDYLKFTRPGNGQGPALASCAGNSLKLVSETEEKKKISQPAIFWDRDGTINEDPGYLADYKKLVLLPDVASVFNRAHQLGYLNFVVTNQSGIGRGLIKFEQLQEVHDRLLELLKPEADGSLQAIYSCPHAPEQNCICRKPKIKSVELIESVYPFDRSNSFMVGDKKCDLDYAWSAGFKSAVLVSTGYGVQTWRDIKSWYQNLSAFDQKKYPLLVLESLKDLILYL